MRIRPRRNRRTAAIRALVEETSLRISSLIYPLFILPPKLAADEVSSMPGIFRRNPEDTLKEVEECLALGIASFILFPAVPEESKDPTATYSYHPDNFYLHTIRMIKTRFPEATVITDVAMDPYSSDGHDGLVKEGNILNDETLPILGKMSLAQAEAGADIIGPSDMMDGRVGYIRDVLDEKGYEEVAIMSYTAKYASACYGPFRDALDSAPKAGDKKTYQMNPANRREALREALLDEAEGADYLMVKPALPYLDVISDLNMSSTLPVVAYQVSGEYAMIKAAAAKGWLLEEAMVKETLTSIKRAGADAIITYFAKDLAAQA
ncbi:MAG: porphobilinogen synthase [Bacteroidota bacterium]